MYDGSARDNQIAYIYVRRVLNDVIQIPWIFLPILIQFMSNITSSTNRYWEWTKSPKYVIYVNLYVKIAIYFYNKSR